MSDTEHAPLTDDEREEWRELVDTPHEDLSDAQVTSKIKLSMKRKYSAPEWVLCFELAGPDGRRVDAVAVNTFPSRNFKVLGFEFKSSRSDWLSEKRDGAKADYFVRCVDEFYVVAGRRGIIGERELPNGWGLLELKDNRDDQLWTLVESDLTEHQAGDPDKAFWGRFLQKTVGETSNFTTEDLEEARSRGFTEGKNTELQRKMAERNIDRLQEKADRWDRLQDSDFGFLPNYGFDHEDIRTLELAWKLVRMVESDSYSSIRGQIEKMERSMDRVFDQLGESVETLGEGFDTLERRIEDGDVPERPDGGEGSR